MKKTFLWLLLFILVTGQLFAQQKVFTVQGIPRPDLSNNKTKTTIRSLQLMDATSDDMYDYSTFSLDSIKFWVGTGSKRAALIIDWYDGKGSQTAMVWGYRWHEDSVRCGLDMIKAIAKADKRFLLLTHYTGGMGNTVAGLGYNLYNNEDQYLIFEENNQNPYFPIDGIVNTTEYNYDSWTCNDPSSHWRSGWYSGYWSYQVKNPDDETFVYSGLGASSRVLEDGSWDGWAYMDFEGGGMSGSLPRMPFLYTPSPLVPFPNYDAYWSEMGKDSTHLSITNTRTARELDKLSEKWKTLLTPSWLSGGQPIIVNGNIYLAVNNKVMIIDKETGETIKENTMAGNCGFFSMIAYGEGKIFVPMNNGLLQAFHAETLEPLWITETKTGYQQICPVVYHDGFVYTGTWKSGTSITGTYYCVSAEDEDPFSSDEIKQYKWESNNVGFYWSGGTIVGDAIVFGGDDGILQSRNRISGELLDTLLIAPELTKSTIRSGIAYDKKTQMLYFTAKEANKIIGLPLNSDGTFKKAELVSGTISGQATTVPIVYNGRVYVTSGTMTSSGGLDVMDALTLNKIYSANIGGISQSSPLISTAYATEANKNTIYIYTTLNNANGNIVCLKDFEGNKEPIIQFTYTPSSKQYCTHSLVADEEGTIYYRNDTKYLFALESIPVEDVISISLSDKTCKMYTGGTKQLNATILPENATNKNISWASLNSDIASVNTTGLVTALSTGETKIIASSEDGNYTDTCVVVIEKMKYTDGVFFVNEDWFGHNNSTINFLDKDENWHYRVYQKENPGKELGCTSQYGTIYGDKLFIVSKQNQDPGASTQGSRLAVVNAETMESLAEFASIGGADGRSFLGVDENKGYISTSNGIYIFDMNDLSIGNQVKGTENTTGSLYSGQIGTMIRTADKVFAVNQQKGVMVIDTKADSILTVIQAPMDGTKQRGFGSIVQSKDGNLWLSVASNTSGNGNAEEYILKLNPYTLDTVRVALPAGASIPNSWYAWTADGFCASTQNNKLYWKNNGGWFNATKIYEYDIDNNTTRTVIDLSTYEPSESWGIYGAGFRLDPVTDDIYVSCFKSFGDPTYKAVKVNPANGTVKASYPMENNYWFPAMPVFPDKYAPVVSDELIDISINKETKVYLGDKINDADNMSVNIVKSIISISNETILKAIVKNDSLIITPVIGQSGTSSIDLQFNSNGKIITKTIAVEVQAINVTSVVLNKNELSLEKDQDYQLTATVLPENATNKNVTWESSNPTVASVENGLITALSQGETTITVTTIDGEHTATCAVTITEKEKTVEVESINLNIENISLEKDSTYQLTATVLPENATNKNVTWESSNPTVASVENGLITALSQGETTITVTTIDGEHTATCAVTITEKEKTVEVESVNLNIENINLKQDSSYQLIATVLPENATNKNVAWESSNISIVTVDENGLITAVAEGEANITVITKDGELTDVCIVTVSANTVGIDKIEANKAKIYPTVTTGKITIVQEKTIENAQILNLSGKLLQTFNLHSLESTIDISSYQSGLYLVRIGNQVVKIIKQ